MIERFRGKRGRSLLIQAFRAQKTVGQHAAVASALASRVTLIEFARGGTLIRQDGWDNSLYFLLSGRVAVLVNGREVATRDAGDHVGEMALLDPGARRSATVIATEPTLVARITERDFNAVANRHPRLWRAIAIELGRRLRQRARFLAEPNPRPVLFVGSSSEALPVAMAVERGLRRASIVVRLWSKGVFGISHFPIEDLESQLRSADFAVLVAAPDDRVISRGQAADSPRDNVVFELGLFMGAISRHRTFVLIPRRMDVKIPTDLLGLTPLRYDPKVRPLSRATSAACRELLNSIRKLGAK